VGGESKTAVSTGKRTQNKKKKKEREKKKKNKLNRRRSRDLMGIREKKKNRWKGSLQIARPLARGEFS